MGRKEQEKARNFFREIRSGALAPVYLFHGAERYLVDRAVEDVIRKRFGDDEPDPFSYEPMRGSDVDGRRIVDACRTVSMLGGQRLVVVREVDALDDSELELVAQYAASPSKRSVLVLTAVKVDGRKKTWKALKKHGNEVLFEQLYRDQMPDWIVRQGRRKGLQVDDAAAEALAEAVGADMTLLNLALEKLALLVGQDGRRVGVEQVRAAVAETRERSVFELTDALSRRDLEGSLMALASLREHGQDYIPITFMIARHVRLLMKVHSGQRRRLSGRELASYVGVSSFFLKDYASGARRFDTAQLVALHALLYEADRQLKSSRLPGQIVLERVITAFCLS